MSYGSIVFGTNAAYPDSFVLARHVDTIPAPHWPYGDPNQFYLKNDFLVVDCAAICWFLSAL